MHLYSFADYIIPWIVSRPIHIDIKIISSSVNLLNVPGISDLIFFTGVK
jgi:hypothetical protein